MITSHLWFDLFAYAAAAGLTLLISRQHPSVIPVNLRKSYLLILTQGVILGSLLLGTMNLHLSGIEKTLGKSILGAICGGIFAVEMFKRHYEIRESTGARLVPGLTLGIIIGRLGCYFDGLEDHTYGVATALPWAVDFGDGVMRHPVQLYECLAMALFLFTLTLAALSKPARWKPWLNANAFYLMAFYYALQRFGWEFLKPYGQVLGPFNLFHLSCMALAAYALFMFSQYTHQAPQPAESPT